MSDGLTELYKIHAAPESILTRLTEARFHRDAIERKIEELENLLVKRTRQIQDGLWPEVTEQ